MSLGLMTGCFGPVFCLDDVVGGGDVGWPSPRASAMAEILAGTESWSILASASLSWRSLSLADWAASCAATISPSDGRGGAGGGGGGWTLTPEAICRREYRYGPVDDDGVARPLLPKRWLPARQSRTVRPYGAPYDGPAAYWPRKTVAQQPQAKGTDRWVVGRV